MKFIAILIFGVLFAFNCYSQDENNLSGRTAPNFKLESIDGKYLELSSFIGEGPVLLSFWATWCKPCLEEMAELQKIYNNYKDRGFNMLAISTDNEKTVAKVKPYIKSKGYSFPVLLDTNSDVARKYYANQMPFSVLIDEKGKIVYSHLGYMKGDEKKVEELIKNHLVK